MSLYEIICMFLIIIIIGWIIIMALCDGIKGIIQERNNKKNNELKKG